MVDRDDRGAAIYVLVDALGWEILRDRSFLDDVIVDRQPVRTILGYSSGAIPTLLTGRYPDEHGHWNLFYRSPDTSPFRWTRALRHFPRALVENRVSRRGIKVLSRMLSGYGGYFPIYNFPLTKLPFFDLCERRDLYAPGGIEGCPSIFDTLSAAAIEYECFNYHRSTDAEIMATVPERVRASSARVFFLYLCELDAYLHFHIGDEAGVERKLRWYEEGLRAIYQAAVKRFGAARLYIFSDHGMTPIRWTYDLGRDIAALGLSTPGDMLTAYDSTMARFWVSSDRVRGRLVDFLSDHPCGRLLTDEDLERLRIRFADGRYGDLVFLLHAGGLVCPSDMGWVRFAGMHGFHPSEPTADAVLLSSVALPWKVADIAGIQDVLLEDLGLKGGGAGP